MPRAICTVCVHPDRIEVEEKLDAGISVRKIADTHGLNRNAIFRHKKANHALTKPAPDDSPVSPVSPDTDENSMSRLTPGETSESNPEPQDTTPEQTDVGVGHQLGPQKGAVERRNQRAKRATPRDPLTPRQHRAIHALLSGKTYRQAAEISGASERAIYSWRAENEAFKAEYFRLAAAQAEAFEARTIALGTASGGVLHNLMAQPTQVGSDVKLRAATAGINAATRLRARHQTMDVRTEPAPLIVFPSGTTPSWLNTKRLPIQAPSDAVIDAEVVEQEVDREG